jgi:hypothetical protein
MTYRGLDIDEQTKLQGSGELKKVIQGKVGIASKYEGEPGNGNG